MSKIFRKYFYNFLIIISVTSFILIIPIYSLFTLHKENNNQEKKILTTTTMLYDAIKHLIGDVDEEEEDPDPKLKYQKIENISIDVLMGIGIDPHNYKTKLSDRNKIKKADLLIVNGLHLEAKMLEAFDQLLSKNTSSKFWKAGEESLEKEDKLTEENSKDCDPHIWFNIDLWIKIVGKLKEQIKTIILSKEDQDKLDNNLEIFQKELKKTKDHIINKMQELKEKIENNGQNKFIIVTAHDAFSYWQNFSESNYCSFELKSIQGISTQTEASALTIINLAKELADNNVKAIFTESSMPKNSLESLKEEVDTLKKQKGLEPIRIPDVELYSDSLGANDKKEELDGKQYKHSTYIGAFLNNLRVIEENLL